MRLTILVTLTLSLSLMSGLGQTELPVAQAGPLFCDVEERRVFTQEELDWRVLKAPAKLRKDWKTNTTWDRECKQQGETSAA